MKRIKTVLILMAIFCVALSGNVNADAGSFDVPKSISLTEGETTTFNITTTNCEGKFTIASSDTSVVKVSSSSIWAPGNENTITVTAVNSGTAKITVTATNVGDTDENDVTGSKTISVTVKAKETPNTNTGTNTNTNTNTNNNSGTTTEQPKEKSTNAYLSTLGVTPKEYDFSGFKKNTMNYSVTIPYDIDSLKVLYKTADSGATVKVTGNSDFEVGSNNKITIKVTAEDGKTTKTYTIKVTKLAEEEEKPGNVIEDEEGLYLTSLELDGVELSPEFAKDTFSYTATLDKSDVTDIEVIAKANKEEAKVEISGNTDMVVGENTINIVLKLDGSSVQTIYQITLTKEDVNIVTTTDTDTEDTNLITDLKGNMNKYIIIAVSVIILMILTVIVLIILLRKENKRLRNKDTIEDEYDVYKNDENEFESNDIEAKEIENQSVENMSNETEIRNKGRRTRREKGRHSK